MSEDLQRAEEDLAQVRVALRRAREYVPQAFTVHGKRRAVMLAAAREARLLGLVAQVLTLRAAAVGAVAVTPPAAPMQRVGPEQATAPAAPRAPRVVWEPTRVDLPYIAERRMRAKLDERVRDIVARSQYAVARGIAAREHRDPWSHH